MARGRRWSATVKIIAYAVARGGVWTAACAAWARARSGWRAPVLRAGHADRDRDRRRARRHRGAADKGARGDRGAARARWAWRWSGSRIVPHADGAIWPRPSRRRTRDMVLILTGSATSDIDDVGARGAAAAGGQVDRFGMPVDPGNLLFLGRTRGAAGDRPAGLRALARAERGGLGAGAHRLRPCGHRAPISRRWGWAACSRKSPRAQPRSGPRRAGCANPL